MWTINTTIPECLLTWDVNSFIGSLVETTVPTLGRLLWVAAQTDRAIEKNKMKSCTTACNVIVTQLAKQRSNHALYLATPFTLFLWTNGASRQTIEALHESGLCISFTSLTNLLCQVAVQSLERAANAAKRFHVLCWDNINIKTSIFVEQRDFAPSKVQSGTFSILYEIQADPDDMHLAPMLARSQNASDLTFNDDIRPTFEQCQAFRSQLRIHIINVLFKFSKSFKSTKHARDLELKHQRRRRIPKAHQTKQFPLRTSTINESSITGNIAVVNDVYINQLKMTHDILADWAIPSINDQSTNARIRGAKTLRAKDVNPFTRLQFLQLGFGLFHLCMNLIWALLHVHRASYHQIGGLSYFFSVPERTRLSGEHPDYHTLLSTLFQILNGLLSLYHELRYKRTFPSYIIT